VVGVYLLEANKPGRCSHVAHGAYMVAKQARQRGVGRAMALHSFDMARGRGFEAMQFNMVVSTNLAAVALWLSLGFRIVGTVPKAFEHRELGRVDGHVMHKAL